MFKTEFLKKLSFLFFYPSYVFPIILTIIVTSSQFIMFQVMSGLALSTLELVKSGKSTLHSYGNPQHDELKDKGNLFGNIYN